jgi:hypothetical protein
MAGKRPPLNDFLLAADKGKLRGSEKPLLSLCFLFLNLIRGYPRKSAAAYCLLFTEVSIRRGVSIKLSCQSSNMSKVQRSLR